MRPSRRFIELPLDMFCSITRRNDYINSSSLYTATLTKSLDAAHHRWQRSILGISWKDRITNVEVRTRTGQQTMDNILAGTRIQERTRSTTSELEGRSQQRPTKDGFTWEEAEVAALDRHGWRRSVAQCVQLDKE